MRKKKLMSCASLALAGMLAFQSVNWSAFNVLADTVSFEETKVLELSFEDNLNDDTGKHTVEASGNVVYESGVNNGKAFNFDGSTYLTLGTDKDLQPEDLTVSFWVKKDGTMGGEEMFLWFKGEYNNNGWYIGSPWDTNTAIVFSIGVGSGGALNGQPLEFYAQMTRDEFFGNNEWVHVTATYDSATQSAQIFRNGEEVAVAGYNGTENSGITADESIKTIGSNGQVYGNGGKTSLVMDEIEIFSSVASSTDVRKLYEKNVAGSMESEKVLELSFEDSLVDDTGKHEVESSGNVVYAEGVNGGKAFNFDGSTYFTLGTDRDLQPEDLTVSFWVNRDGTMGGEEMFLWFKGEYNNNGWYIGSPWDTNTALVFSIGVGSGGALNGQPLEFYAQMTRDEFFGNNEWVHVTATYDSETQTAQIYRNGEEIAVAGYNATENSGITADDCVKSIGSNGAVYGHGGKTTLMIDEIEVFSKVASSNEVKTLYTKNGGVIVEDSEEDEDDDITEYIGNISAYDLWDVDVTDAYLTNAETKDIEYLLLLDSDKLLAGFRETAGLDMQGATRYGGWENSLIGSHTMGHYITAVSQAVASLPDTDSRRAQLVTKLEYIIDELKECQDALGTGFIFGATIKDQNNVELQFDNVEKGRVNIGTEAWVPWYTMHKILAGVIDAYKYTGNETALEVAKSLGDWVYGRTSSWSTTTRNTVLGIEYGGMNDCLYELYAVTGIDTYAEAAHAFDEDTLFENVNKGLANVLNGRHANTTIPKFMGALNRYVTTHDKTVNGEVVDASKYLEYAENFFAMVLENHTYITGDNSEWEHFGADNILDAERTNCNCETCNAYNMMKFAKALYMVTGDTQYLDYYETAFYNTILSSQNPETGMTTYFQPMKSGYFKVYGTETTKFWCCTGSGMENFTKLGNAIYYYNEDMIIVNQYLSSVLNDTDKGVTLTQTADIPASDVATFNVATTKGNVNVAFRLPEWLASDAVVKVNGTEVEAKLESGYAIVENVADGTEITVQLPMEIRAYNLPDGESVYGFKYGPIVLSAKLGTTNMVSTTTGVDVTIPSSALIEEEYISDGSETVSVLSGTVTDFMANINENLVKVEGKLEWVLENTDANLTFVPHYSQHTERYGIYFDYVSNEGAFNVTKYIRDKAQTRFNEALLDTVQPAYGQYENDELHDMVDNGSTPTVAETTRYANAGGSFTYTMKVAEGEDNCLQVTFDKEDNGKTIKIAVGNTVVYEGTLNYTGNDEQYTVRIPVSKDVVAAAAYEKTVTDGTFDVVDVVFSSADSNASARVCNFVYMTKAYSNDTSLNLTAKDATVEKNGDKYSIELGADVTSLDLTAALASEYGYVRVNGNVIRNENPYTVDLSSVNFVELEIEVYAEDHETTKTYAVSITKAVDTANRENVDKDLAYFVNCGDYDVTTLSEGDLFGIYNGVTDNAYGMDPVTGYKWGIVDTLSNPLKNGTVTNNPAMTNAVFTDNTWTFETNAALDDTSDKTLTNRYTKNQFENGMDRNLKYAFELPNGKYTVAMYFTDPWNCSKNPIVAAEGVEKVAAGAVNEEFTFDVEVLDGELLIDVTSPAATLCLNLSYIKVYIGEQYVTPDEPNDDDTDSEGTTTDKNETTDKDETTNNEGVKEEVAEGSVSKEEVADINEGASVEGVEEDIEIVVDTVDKAILDEVKAFIDKEFKDKDYAVLDLKLMKGDKEVQPDGKIKVTIPVPSQLKDAEMVEVYRVEDDGTKTKVGKVAVKDGKITFETDHFSTYVFIEAKADVVENPYTGDSVNMLALMLMAAVAGGTVILVTRRKKVTE